MSGAWAAVSATGGGIAPGRRSTRARPRLCHCWVTRCGGLGEDFGPAATGYQLCQRSEPHIAGRLAQYRPTPSIRCVSR